MDNSKCCSHKPARLGCSECSDGGGGVLDDENASLTPPPARRSSPTPSSRTSSTTESSRCTSSTNSQELFGITKTKRVLLAAFTALAFVIFGVLIEMPPSFYPSRAEEKGATPSQYGFVFGISSLTAFIFAPIFAHVGGSIGPWPLFIAGCFAQSLYGITFGFLDFIENNTTLFLGLSYLLRSLDGLAQAACNGAILSILMELFPSRVASITAWTEMCSGLGFIIGPAIGSLLFSFGGFMLPFLSMGLICLAVSLVLVFLVPSSKSAEDEESFVERDDDEEACIARGQRRVPSLGGKGGEETRVASLSGKGDEEEGNLAKEEREGSVGDESNPLTFTAVFSSLPLFLPYVDNFVGFIGSGMIEAMLEPHLKKSGVKATQTQVSIVFVVLGCTYMVTTPLAGYVCDRIRLPVIISLVGNVVMAVVFVIIGPAPFLDLEPSFSLSVASTVVAGLGYGLVLVASFSRAHRAAINRGYDDDINSYLIITGMWVASYHLGNFVGPTAAGFVVEAVGFRSTTLYFFVPFVVMAVVDLIVLATILWRKRSRSSPSQLFE